MELWAAQTGGFWWRAILSLVLLLLVGEACHVHIVPARYYWTDAFILAPLALCWVLSVRAGPGIDYVTRGVYGVFQATVLIFVYSNYWGRTLRLGDPFSAFWDWVILTSVYSMLFAGLTQSIVVGRSQTRSWTQCRSLRSPGRSRPR